MPDKKYILAIDQGTTSSRAIVFDTEGQIKGMDQKEFTQLFPKPGWVEHDPSDLWSTVAGTARAAIEKAGIAAADIAARDRLEGHLWRLAEKVADRAKARDLAGRTVTLKLRRQDFTEPMTGQDEALLQIRVDDSKTVPVRRQSADQRDK